MKRVIKFRAWDGKKFIYPSVIGILLEDFAWEHDRGYIHNCQEWGSEDGFIMEPVLEQFTGLLDKNGKEVFEGDIFDTVLNSKGRPLSNAKLIYEDGSFILQSPARYEYLHYFEHHTELSVIGNIHENPELT